MIYNFTMKTQDKKHTTLRLPPDDMKKLKMFCLENDISVQVFLEYSVRYCMKNKIIPDKKK